MRTCVERLCGAPEETLIPHLSPVYIILKDTMYILYRHGRQRPKAFTNHIDIRAPHCNRMYDFWWRKHLGPSVDQHSCKGRHGYRRQNRR